VATPSAAEHRDLEQRLRNLERSTQAAASADSTRSGVVLMFAGSAAPAGYLLCDGAAVSRTAYPALFDAIGTTHGVGDGSTTFNVPNLKGRVPVGRDAGQTEFDALGETGGEKTHVLTIAEMPSHNHPPASPTSNFIGNGSPFVVDTSTGSAIGTATTTGNTGGGGAHNNLQPYLVLNFIIKT
jgi:microcystin-dependent protein